TLEERPDGKSWLRYIHHGVNLDPEHNQEDAVQQHTDFYLHTLNEYVTHFAGLDAAFVDLQGPESSAAPDAFDRVRKALGLINTSKVDDSVQVTIGDSASFVATIDYISPNFIGLRTETALYRVFGRNAFGATVGLTIHVFDPADDAVAASAKWQAWLDGLYTS
ncbi:MAG TPA: SRPBCC domain-containing protein, partial [Glaciihabitans sp.]|nr:SRPBCC domain-containing protein [Glaciihabitans sp.]